MSDCMSFDLLPVFYLLDFLFLGVLYWCRFKCFRGLMGDACQSTERFYEEDVMN